MSIGQTNPDQEQGGGGGGGGGGGVDEGAVSRLFRISRLRKVQDLLLHTVRCRRRMCDYRLCKNVKFLLNHGMSCRIRAAGGCRVCYKLWYLLLLHAHSCTNVSGICPMPRCRDLKQHMKTDEGRRFATRMRIEFGPEANV